MLRAYFASGVVDADDHDHAAAVRDGVVPAACLMGGPTISLIHSRGEDPCAICPWDRAKCGGRPQASLGRAVNDAVQLANLNAASAHKDIRTRYIETMNGLMARVEDERSIRAGQGRS